MNNIIKTIAPVNCPHCQKMVMVEFNSTPTVITSVYGQEDVLTAKADVLLKVNELNIPEERKDDIVKWVNDPETIFGPSEVNAIINNAKINEETTT